MIWSSCSVIDCLTMGSRRRCGRAEEDTRMSLDEDAFEHSAMAQQGAG